DLSYGQQHMLTREFESTVQFSPFQTETGEIVSYPVVTVNLIRADGSVIRLPLLFDTGASVTSLRHDLYPLLGLSSWDVGTLQQTQTAGGEDPVDVYRYEGITFEVFGKVLICPVNLIKMPQHPLFVGLLGRDTIFQEFGFGFWERTQELHVTTNP
ncbi:MAG: retropepsin-like domain-containing protein, partial [Proteobacteria bacterium]|nr:retropepsin-like domain-containing protein [Pseudomonadota bacterium]